jgi:hypothetical protein
MSTLDDWTVDAAEALGLPADSITHDLRTDLLDLTRDVAHGVARPAGPLTTNLVGLAVGPGVPVSTAISRLSELAAARADRDEEGDEDDGRTSAGPA